MNEKKYLFTHKNTHSVLSEHRGIENNLELQKQIVAQDHLFVFLTLELLFYNFPWIGVN